MIYPAEEYNRATDEERFARQYTNAVLNFFDRLYVLHQSGTVDDQIWRGWEPWIEYAFGTGDYFGRAWDANCAVCDPGFVRYIKQRYGDGVCSPGVRTGVGRSAGTPIAAVS
ncbi:MAG: hypothetical protein U0031_19595 [Thermomicrobiales bacterium]